VCDVSGLMCLSESNGKSYSICCVFQTLSPLSSHVCSSGDSHEFFQEIKLAYKFTFKPSNIFLTDHLRELRTEAYLKKKLILVKAETPGFPPPEGTIILRPRTMYNSKIFKEIVC
jgi:hypothetical protein